MSSHFSRRFSSVTTKVQKRRDEHIQFKFPEYTGNEVVHSLPRRGRRLGGAFIDPSRSIGKLDGSTDTEPFLGEAKRDKIRTLVSTDLHVTLSKSRVHRMALPSNPKYVNNPSLPSDSIEESSGKQEDTPKALEKKKRTKGNMSKERPVLFPIVRDEDEVLSPPLESSIQLRESAAGPFWASQGATFIDLYSTAVPSVFSSTLAEYRLAKEQCVVFDVSYQQVISVMGTDALLVMDHFVAGPLRLMLEGDVISTCLLDGKGDVLTTATVAQTGSNNYEICMAGNSRESVFRYLAQFVLHSRQSGLVVHMNPISHPALLHFHGPSRLNLLGDLLGQPHIAGMPAMCRIMLAQVVITNLTDHAIVSGLLPDARIVPGGAYALDMLRMEAGRPRPDLDIAGSPITASLAWTLDQSKVREKFLFGHERIAREIIRGPKTKRVRIIAESYVYGGCAILSAPHRFPIGRVTSCTWSPERGKRMCQAIIKTEYCVENTSIFVNVPHAPPDTLEFRFRRRIAKQGNLQTVFRNLIPANVIA